MNLHIWLPWSYSQYECRWSWHKPTLYGLQTTHQLVPSSYQQVSALTSGVWSFWQECHEALWLLLHGHSAWYLLYMQITINMSNTWVAYHLEKVSGKSSWEANGTWLLGSFQQKISGRNGTSKKVVVFFWTEYSKWKFGFHFFPIALGLKAIQHTAVSTLPFSLSSFASFSGPVCFFSWALNRLHFHGKNILWESF